ncbi:MAG: CPBP family intramembrane metalloprotease [Candidatus Marinimicrobia bacterium]|jgi:membrane protease YdiL (CAAX protease family)|nr:CPBP family intramembrane metalloprotease [Candidatus Neomarinimicrobiota bacterium]MBT3682563.1 CPBP family intramembrane metalloprotease [Candidatus Neomarinimicrobiota bacterium]MBT4851582.1 CPBP family intramembrane metalloprotease [Candidatus Neomarinimicrobiota bacterium]MBT5211331.1 CPBP family intramembrane metalloprotease [Candidatus Neomarinimicrobiota bacterium]MBT5538363.1 CPBP family intramembrane metalloprotease [Candidatus Neomarinimicrobiota bacterium]
MDKSFSFRIIEKQPVILFSAVVIAISVILTGIAILVKNVNITFLNVFVPTIIAILFTGITLGRKGIYQLLIGQVFRKTSMLWLFISIIFFPLISFLAISLHSYYVGQEFTLMIPQVFPPFLTIFVIAIGEEFGWRGYLLPKLMERYNAIVSSLLLGCIWGAWHFPGYSIGVGVPLSLSFLVFMIWILSASFIMTWIYNNTGSVLTAILLHASANAIFTFFPILPMAAKSTIPFWLFLCFLNFIIVGIIIVSGSEKMVRKK